MDCSYEKKQSSNIETINIENFLSFTVSVDSDMQWLNSQVNKALQVKIYALETLVNNDKPLVEEGKGIKPRVEPILVAILTVRTLKVSIQGSKYKFSTTNMPLRYQNIHLRNW